MTGQEATNARMEVPELQATGPDYRIPLTEELYPLRSVLGLPEADERGDAVSEALHRVRAAGLYSNLPRRNAQTEKRLACGIVAFLWTLVAIAVAFAGVWDILHR